MTAKLSILFNDKRAENFTLTDPTTFIGRSDENEIQINHASVSRKHCVVERKGDEYLVSDMGSLNGTFVGEKLANRTRIKHGDRIQIGDFTAIFEPLEEMPMTNSKNVSTDEAEIRLPPDSVFLPINKSLEGITKDLSGILNIAKQINVIDDIGELQKEILSQIFEIVPASEGALISVDDSHEMTEVVGFNRRNGSDAVKVSRTVLNRVLKEKGAILASDVIRDDRSLRSESLAIAGTLSLLCVPMILFDKIIGAIYLTTDQTIESFDESHLRLVIAISSIASVALENARSFRMLKSENARLRTGDLLDRNMIGESAPMQRVFDCISKSAPTESTVLISGESGTGKELAAQSIHLNSLRHEKQFVVINCATITESLLETELFGHEKGSFTGAIKQKKGKIELASGGTLFLDEIGELAPALQVKLLRVLQEREFERVGGTKPIHVDIRLIAATNRDLEEEVKLGKFREDLYYRLNVIHLLMPPLRDRGPDIRDLAAEFLKKYARHANRSIRGISAKASKILCNYDFPGNVRELENAIESAIVLGSSDWIQPEDLPEKFVKTKMDAEFSSEDQITNLHDGVREAKKRLVCEAFQKANGNYVNTAKILEVHPNYLHRLIKVLGIKSDLKAGL